MVLRTLATGILLTASAFAQMSSFPKPSLLPRDVQEARHEGRAATAGAASGLREERQTGAVPAGLPRTGDGQQHQHPDPVPVAGDIEEQHHERAYGAFGPFARLVVSPRTGRPATPSRVRRIDGPELLPHALPTRFPSRSDSRPDAATRQTVSANGGGSKSARTARTRLFRATWVSPNPALVQNRGAYITRVPIMQAQTGTRARELSLRRTSAEPYSTPPRRPTWNAILRARDDHVGETARNPPATTRTSSTSN